MDDLRAATRLALSGWKANLGYGIVVAVAVTVLLGPAISWLLVKGLQIAAGGTVLNYDIAGFVLSPAGVVVFLLWATLVALLAVLAQGGHVYVAAARAAGHPVRLGWILRRVLADLPRVPGLGAIQLALLSVLLTPLIAAAASAVGGLLLAPFQGAALLERLPRGRTLLLLLGLGGALLALGFWLYVRWSLTVPAFCLEGRRLGGAVQESGRRTKGHFRRVATAHLLHHAGWGLLVAVVTLLLGVGLRPLVRHVVATRPDALPLVTAALLVLVGAILGLLTLFGVARLVALTVVQHERLGGTVDVERLRLPPPDLSPEGRRRRSLVVLGALVLFGVATAFVVPEVRGELDRLSGPPSITAHRGSSIEAPQNTLAAVRLAIEDGADACEFDVHQAADGALVVVHDANLKALAGLDVNVYDLDGAELTRIDVGSHGGFADRFAGEPIPTLAQVIDVAKGRIALNVELKVHGRERPGYAEDVVALLREKDMLDEATITSLDAGILRTVRRLEPRLRIGAIITAKIGRASTLECDLYSVQPLIATVAFIRKAHAEGREVHVWTLNEAADLLRYADRGADAVITDVPRLARELYAKRTPGDELEAALRRLFE